MDMPYGLTDMTAAFRAYLGNIIATMTERGLGREQIGQITGLNKHESHRAERRPYAHDWKLSQIERVLKWKEINDPT